MALEDSWNLHILFLNWIKRQTRFYWLFQPQVLFCNLREQLLYKSYMRKLDPVNLVRLLWLFHARLKRGKKKNAVFLYMGVSCAFPSNKQKILKNNGLIQISGIDLADVLPAGTKARSCLILWGKECQPEWLPRAPQSSTCAEHTRCPVLSQALARSARPRAELGLGWKPPHVFMWLMSLGRQGEVIYCLVLQPPSPQFYF